MSVTDPRGLIREAYRIEGITEGECRSIFLDWALGREGEDRSADIDALLALYRDGAPEHPMTRVLEQARAAPPRPKRRGGWRGRRA